jgi:hypothetical protein
MLESLGGQSLKTRGKTQSVSHDLSKLTMKSIPVAEKNAHPCDADNKSEHILWYNRVLIERCFESCLLYCVTVVKWVVQRSLVAIEVLKTAAPLCPRHVITSHPLRIIYQPSARTFI